MRSRVQQARRGSAVASLAAFPAFDAMRQALPMVQSILLMAVYIMLPLILAFAAYEFSTLITLTFVVFALNFLTFWWELARWLDSWMLTALYSSDTHSRVNMMGLQNTSDDIIMNFVMGTMFIILPAVWLGGFIPGRVLAQVLLLLMQPEMEQVQHIKQLQRQEILLGK